MGSCITSMVAWLLALPGMAKTFMWQDFKAYRGGLLVVRSTRSHKVARRTHTPLRACAVPGPYGVVREPGETLADGCKAPPGESAPLGSCWVLDGSCRC